MNIAGAERIAHAWAATLEAPPAEELALVLLDAWKHRDG